MAEDQLTAMFTANGVEVTYLAVSGTGILTDQGVRLDELQAALEDAPPRRRDHRVVLQLRRHLHPRRRHGRARPTASCCGTCGRPRPSSWCRWPRPTAPTSTWWSRPGPWTSAWFSGLEDRIEHFNEIYRSLGVPVIDWDLALYPDGTTTGLDVAAPHRRAPPHRRRRRRRGRRDLGRGGGSFSDA